jgi:glycosyltransferase involved in cell wall biosynthesis
MLSEGIRLAKGDIILFLDDDDMFEPTKIKSALGVFETHKSVTYYHNNPEWIDASGRLVPPPRWFNSIPKEGLCPRRARDLIRKGADKNLSSTAIRRQHYLPYIEFIDSIEGLTDVVVQWMGLMTNGEVWLDPSGLTRVRLHDRNTTTSQQFRDQAAAFSKMLKTMESLSASNHEANRYARFYRAISKQRAALAMGDARGVFESSIRLSTLLDPYIVYDDLVHLIPRVIRRRLQST